MLLETRQLEMKSKQAMISSGNEQLARLEHQLKEQKALTEKALKEYDNLNQRTLKLQQDLEEQLHTNTQLFAEKSVDQIGASVPTPGEHLCGFKPIVKLTPSDLRDGRPDRSLERDPLFITRDTPFFTPIPVVLDDHDRLFPRGRNLDAENVLTECGRRTEVNRLGLLAHCSTSPCCNSIPSLLAKSLRSCPEAK